MASITFTSDPSGANVEITPINDGVSDLEAFRAECMSGGEVVCDWATLESRLNDHIVSMLWWELAENERRSITEMAIKNTFFYQINYKGTGKADCAGAEEFKLLADPCGANSIIRYLKFATSNYTLIDSCYWKRGLDSEEHCFRADNTYKLPCHFIECNKTGIDWVHFMCGMQVVNKTDHIDNWIVFQYNDFDIKPGNLQMPQDSAVKIIDPTHVACSSVGYSTPLAEFNI